jgi:hypothetical protein
MEQKLVQIQINKEPPEALEVVNLDALTSKILKRSDISDWEKADMLASSLERFLALRNQIKGTPSQPVVPSLNRTTIARSRITRTVIKKPPTRTKARKVDFSNKTPIRSPISSRLRKRKTVDPDPLEASVVQSDLEADDDDDDNTILEIEWPKL